MKEEERGVVMSYKVRRDEGFQEAASALYAMVRQAQAKFPNKRRIILLEIEGHRNERGGFDGETAELQKDFVVDFLMTYISEIQMPLLRLQNINQSNDMPNELTILNKHKK